MKIIGTATKLSSPNVFIGDPLDSRFRGNDNAFSLWKSQRKIFFKSSMLVIIFCSYFMPMAFAWTEADQNQFEKANEDYRSERYDEAIRAYEELTVAYPKLGMINFNLGNAYMRKDQAGEAILSYERALKYEPRNRDIRYNLDFVRGRLEYKMEDKRNWYLRFAEKALGYFTEKEMATLTLGTFFFFLLSWVIALFRQKQLPWGPFRKGLLLVTFLCAALLAAKVIQTRAIRGAIVLENEVSFYFGPSKDDQVAFRLGEGLKVYVMDHRKDWSRVLLANGETGWARTGQVVEI